MTTYSEATGKRLDIALLVLRLVLAAVFITHGYAKVFHMGFSGVSGFFTSLGVPMSGVAGPFVALVELVGGIALLFGVFTRVFGFLLPATCSARSSWCTRRTAMRHRRASKRCSETSEWPSRSPCWGPEPCIR